MVVDREIKNTTKFAKNINIDERACEPEVNSHSRRDSWVGAKYVMCEKQVDSFFMSRGVG